MPDSDIRVTDKFLDEHEPLLSAIGRALLDGALATPGAVDFDVRDALTGLIRTYRTLQSGLYYETLPDNAIAAPIFRATQEGIEAFKREEQERMGVAPIRDADVLVILVFFEHLELHRNNRRRRGRAFLDFLRGIYSVPPGAAAGPASLLVG